MNKAAIIGSIIAGGIIAAFGVAKILQGDADLKNAVNQLDSAKTRLDSALVEINNAHTRVDSIMHDLSSFTGTANRLNLNVQNLDRRIISSEYNFKQSKNQAMNELNKNLDDIKAMLKRIPDIEEKYNSKSKPQ